MAFLSFYSNENKYAIKVFIRPENEVTSRYVGRVIYYNENNKTPDCNQAGSLNVRVSPGRWYISFEYDIREQAFTDPRTLWDTWVDVSNGTGVYVSASSRMMEGSYSCDWKSLY